MSQRSIKRRFHGLPMLSRAVRGGLIAEKGSQRLAGDGLPLQVISVQSIAIGLLSQQRACLADAEEVDIFVIDGGEEHRRLDLCAQSQRRIFHSLKTEAHIIEDERLAAFSDARATRRDLLKFRYHRPQHTGLLLVHVSAKAEFSIKDTGSGIASGFKGLAISHAERSASSLIASARTNMDAYFLPMRHLRAPSRSPTVFPRLRAV